MAGTTGEGDSKSAITTKVRHTELAREHGLTPDQAKRLLMKFRHRPEQLAEAVDILRKR